MNKSMERRIRKFVSYIRKTYKNKLYGLLAIGFGVGIAHLTGVGDLLLILIPVGVYLFFSKIDWFGQGES